MRAMALSKPKEPLAEFSFLNQTRPGEILVEFSSSGNSHAKDSVIPPSKKCGRFLCLDLQKLKKTWFTANPRCVCIAIWSSRCFMTVVRILRKAHGSAHDAGTSTHSRTGRSRNKLVKSLKPLNQPKWLSC